jgi:hypothetical protein
LQFPVEVAKDLELRDGAAFLVRDDGGKEYRPVYRQMLLSLPINRNNTGTLNVDSPNEGEYLVLLLRIGTEKGGLMNRELSHYELVIGKQE